MYVPIDLSDTDLTSVYCITNSVNGKRYIGSSAKSFKARWKCHINDLKRNCHYSKHLQSAWNKYGENNFGIKFSEEFKKKLSIASTGNKRCLGRVLSPETKDKIRQKAFGRKASQNVKDAVSRTHKGVPKSEETRRRMSENMKRRWANPQSRMILSAAIKGGHSGFAKN